MLAFILANLLYLVILFSFPFLGIDLFSSRLNEIVFFPVKGAIEKNPATRRTKSLDVEKEVGSYLKHSNDQLKKL